MKHLRIKGIEMSIGQSRGGIFKLLWSPEIDSKESILPVYVAWRAGIREPFEFVFGSIEGSVTGMLWTELVYSTIK
jgi:hypothetical protein